MNNNNNYHNTEPSHEDNTSYDDGKKNTVTDPNCGHLEQSGTGSDTGTYTVENEEDGDDLRQESEVVISSSECRVEDVKLKSEEVETGSSEWVSEWASNTTSMEVRDVSEVEHCYYKIKNLAILRLVHTNPDLSKLIHTGPD